MPVLCLFDLTGRPIWCITIYVYDRQRGRFSLISRELKKGSTEILILALLEESPRHGYEIGKAIGRRSEGVLEFHAASLYPMLYRLEERGWIEGTWEEKPGTRRRRHYSLTRTGHRVLAQQRKSWSSFIAAMERIAGIRHA